MATTGKAAVFDKAGEPMEIQEFKISDPKEGWSLIKVAMCNVCGSDLHTWRGETPPFGRGGMPVILGHEMTGTVYKLGKGVHKDAMGKPLKEGDRVVYSYYSSCGHCPSCLTGAVNECGESLIGITPEGKKCIISTNNIKSLNGSHVNEIVPEEIYKVQHVKFVTAQTLIYRP